MKKRTRARILSLLLALVMCLGLLPLTALAVSEPTLFLEPNTGYFPSDNTVTVNIPFLAKGPTISVPGYHPQEYTVRLILLSANDGTSSVRETEVLQAGSNTVNLQNRGKLGYRLVSISPETEYTIDSDQLLLTYDLAADTDITVESYYLDIDHTITYHPNGAGDTYTESVKNGYLLAEPEAPSLPGYQFLGWYTGTPGANGYLAGYKLDFPYRITNDLPLYAMWKKTASSQSSYEITFFPNGGSLIRTSAIEPDEDGFCGWAHTNLQGLLEQLPEAEREGYTFDGWYIIGEEEISPAIDGMLTNFSNRQKMSLSKVFTANAYVAAKWVKAEKNCVVTYHFNDGSGRTERQTVTAGKGINLLDDPVRAGYTFQGWISGDVAGGKIINATHWYNGDLVTGDLILYAAWAKGETDETLKGLTYRFGNWADSYGYSNGYKIPLERYQFIFGKTQRAVDLWNQSKEWGGSCFGMSSTSGMFFREGNHVDTNSFNSNANTPYDLSTQDQNSSWKLTTQQFIEAMQIAQQGDTIQNDYKNNKNNLSGLCSSVESFDRSGPVIIAVFQGSSGHAVVGYDVESVSDKESHLKIYDCNYPNTEKYITLYKNSSGRYTGWYYYLGKDSKNNDIEWGTEYGNSWISYIPYTDYYQAWNNRANTVSSANSLLFLKTDNATVLDNTGKVAATIDRGEVKSERSDVYPLINIGFTLDGASESSNTTALWLPSNDMYTIKTSSPGNWEATLVNVDQSATVTTSASSVTFSVVDDSSLNYVQIDQAGADYDITLSSSLDQGNKDVNLTGKTETSGTTVAQVSGKLYGTGISSESTLKVEGKNADVATLSSAMPNVGNLIHGSTTQQPTQPSGTNPFTDVAAGSYYYDAVLWAVENGVTAGTSATTFSPDASCTRGQIVTFLWRAAGSPKPTSAINPFTDVRAGSYYYDAVLWAVEQGITSGTSATTFSPDVSCTRGQTVTFLWRAAGSPKPASATNPFSDVQAGAYYADAVAWAVTNGITSGTSATTFSPDATVTRGQTVAFLYRSQGK